MKNGSTIKKACPSDSVRLPYGMSSFEGFKQNGFLCDFDVEVGGKSFRVHRTVLAASSEFFEAMFSSNLKEVHDSHVNMKDVDQDGIAQCIEFMYKGKADLRMENIQHILQASHFLQMANLTEHCFQYLQTNVSSGNCLFVINLAQMYDRLDIKQQAEKVVITHFKSVISSEMFPFVTKSDLLRYMRNQTYQMSWKAVVTWARRKDDVDVFELVHIDKFPFRFILETVLEEPIVKKNKTTKDSVITALFSDVKKLETGLEIDNCFTLKNLAETHQVNDPNAVKNVITCFLGANFERVIEKREFLDIGMDDILALFKSSNTKYSSEDVKWEAMMKWVNHSVGNRRKIFPDLFSFLKLEHLSLEFLKETVRVEPLVKKAEKCNDMLMEEIFSRASKAVPQISSMPVPNSTTRRRQIEKRQEQKTLKEAFRVSSMPVPNSTTRQRQIEKRQEQKTLKEAFRGSLWQILRINVPPSSGRMTRMTQQEKIVITYSFPAGNLEGYSYIAHEFTEYLPNNGKGERIFRMLEEAFNKGLIFKMDRRNGVRIIWDEKIPHLTEPRMTAGGDYLLRLTEALNNMGIY
uniref:uncharacterized protein LOC120344071 n=1 Tax=Styela clava TaxID=7725 RepID=UPI00193968ED|nr:uncharacterized protein LOC120344071 [Styela clava]